MRRWALIGVAACLTLGSTSPKMVTNTIRISFVGDIMVHGEQLKRARREKENHWDFNPALMHVASVLKQSHEVIGNLETTLAGKDGALRKYDEQHVEGYQGYPEFNTPDPLAEALKSCGFTILTTANNHSFDSGTKGVIRTNTTLDRNGLRHTGTGSPLWEPLLFTHHGVRFALISTTYGTNVSWKPAYDSNLSNSLENYKPERINALLDSITALRKSGTCDIIIISIHFGSEYRESPSPWQQRLASSLLAAGADIVAGHHPHILQPAEIRTIRDRTGRIRTCAILFSLGNFLSSYRDSGDYPPFCDTGVIATLEFLPGSNGVGGELKGIEVIPVWTQWTKKEIRVLPLDAALDPDRQRSFRLSSADQRRIREAADYACRIFGSRLKLRQRGPGVWYHEHHDGR